MPYHPSRPDNAWCKDSLDRRLTCKRTAPPPPRPTPPPAQTPPPSPGDAPTPPSPRQGPPSQPECEYPFTIGGDMGPDAGDVYQKGLCYQGHWCPRKGEKVLTRRTSRIRCTTDLEAAGIGKSIDMLITFKFTEMFSLVPQRSCLNCISL